CAGKTTLMSRAVQELAQRGIEVLICPEAATSLIAGMNVKPGLFPDDGFQKFIMQQQFFNEKMLEDMAKSLTAETGRPAVILCDRGKLDSLAYAPENVIHKLLQKHGSNLIEARDSYEAVIHLTTAAAGALDAYTLSNNAARSETPEEAVQKDAAVLRAWTGHPHLSIIDNKNSFEEKIAKAIQSIFSVLGIPYSVEKERKFLIHYPCLSALKKYGAVKSEIVQTYLPSISHIERRVRQRGDGKDFSFFYTEKQDSEIPEKRFEKERMISTKEYLSYLTEADYQRVTPIQKDRYCFPYLSQYMELDIYAGETDYAILEVEFSDDGSHIVLPPEIHLIAEVTGDKRYSNRYLAEHGGRFPADLPHSHCG
ncbi:MAG: AAA family ATPase, partial [Oscillospiraceae bacterium]|nr:AAA family ATPase [Oscillospiraceae bacterium]